MESKLFKKLFSMILVVAMVLSMCPTFVFAEGTAAQSAVNRDPDGNGCPHCEGAVTWTEVAKGGWNSTTTLATGHYKLMGAQSTANQILIDTGANVCIDLNGFDIAKGSGTHRIFQVSGELTVLDSTAAEVEGVYTSGAITGGRYSSSATTDLGPKGGNILVNTGATFNLYSGAVKDGAVTGTAQGSHRYGGNIYGRTGSEINMYGGLISGGTILKGSYLNTNDNRDHGGGNIGSFGDVNIYGGTIKDGYVDNWDNNYRRNEISGGNIAVHLGTGLDGKVNELYIANATITGGNLQNDRGHIYASAITDDYARGGNVFAHKVNVTIVDSTITDGIAMSQIILTGTTNADGTPIPGRNAYAYGGNIYVHTGDLTISGNTTISGGVALAATPAYEGDTGKNTANSYAGNVYHYGGDLTISGNVTISDGQATVTPTAGTKTGSTYSYGGNMFLSSSVIDIDGASITGGTNYYRGGNIYANSCSGTFDNTTFSGGKNTLSSGRGGNIFSASSTLTFTDCTVSGGTNGKEGRGGNLCFTGTNDTITIDGGTWTALTDSGCEYGANIYATDGYDGAKIVIGGGAVLNGGKATYGGNIAAMYGHVVINDATVQNGSASSAGGNFYITGTGYASVLTVNNGAVIKGGRTYLTNNDKDTVITVVNFNTGAVLDSLTAQSQVDLTIADGVKINADPAKYMTGEATVKAGSTYTTYGTLKAALEAAKDGQTVNMVKDADAAGAKVSAAITLNQNEKALTGTIELLEDGALTAAEGLTVIENFELKCLWYEDGTYSVKNHNYIFNTETSEGTCSNCGNTVVCSEHVYGAYTPDGNATCLADGTKTAYCTICGSANTVADEGSMKNHEFDENYNCINGCGKTYCDYNEHITGEANQEDLVNATCKAAGSYNIVVRCVACNEVLSTEAHTIDQLAHVYNDEGICVNGCNALAGAKVTKTDGSVVYYTNVADALVTENNTGATILVLKTATVTLKNYFNEYSLRNVTLATAEGVTLKDNSGASGGVYYFNGVTFAKDSKFELNGYPKFTGAGVSHIYGYVDLYMTDIGGDLVIHGDEGGYLRFERNTWIGADIRVIGNGPDHLVMEANYHSGDYNIYASGGTLTVENAKIVCDDFEWLKEKAETTVANLTNATVECARLFVGEKCSINMLGGTTFTVAGASSFSGNGYVTMTATDVINATDAGLQNTKILAAEGFDGCVYYADGVYTVAAHTYADEWAEGKKPCTNNCGAELSCEHDFQEIVKAENLASAATCNAAATYYKSCSVCGEKSNETFSYGEKDANNHENLKQEAAQAPSCNTIGWEAYEHCDACGYSSYVELPAGHTDLHQEEAKTPTCNAIGWNAYEYCGDCDYTTYVELGKDANNHENLKQEAAKAPTCTEDGWFAYEHCDACGHSTYKVDPQTGHTYTYTSNKDKKTHTIGCEKGDYTEIADCADANGDKFCDKCAQKLIDPKFTVDGVEVETLDEALALAVSGSVIKLLDNVVLTERLTLDKELRIDLEGFSITGAFEDAFGMIYVKKGATVTFVDGLIENTADVAIGNYGYVIVSTDATVNGVGAGLYNFYYQADYYGGSRISGEVNAIWNSGELVISEDAVVEYLDNSGYATIYGTVNEIYAQDGSDAPGVYNSGLLIISDVAKVTTLSIPEDYKLVEVEPYTYKVVACNYVAEVNGQKYETFEEAFAVVPEDVATVVTLMKDIVLTERLTIRKGIILDMAGFSITGNVADAYGMIYVASSGGLWLQNGTVTNEGGLAIGNYGFVSVGADATVIGAEEDAGLYNFYFNEMTRGVATINGSVNVVWNCGEVVVNVGGHIDYLDNSGWATIEGTVDQIFAQDGSDCPDVTGAGTLMIVDTSNVTLPDGFKLLEVAENVYKVVAKVYVAEVNGEKFETLAEALAADGEVKLVADIDATASGVIVAAGEIIDLNGYKLTADIIGVTIKMNGGTFATSEYLMVGTTEGKYTSTDAIFTIAPNATMDMTIVSGTITLNETLWYTMEGQTLTIEKNATFVIPAGKTLYVNGSKVVVNGTAANFGTLILANGAHLKGDVAGTFQMAGGTFETSKYVMIGAAAGKYLSNDAVFTVAPNATMDMTFISGTVTLNETLWYTLEDQTLTVNEGAKFVIPAGKTLYINESVVVVNGEIEVEGTVQLTANATVAYADGTLADKFVTNEGDTVIYENGVYKVHNHSYATKVTDPTCTEKGFTTYTCTCGDEYVAGFVDETGHSHENIGYTDPTTEKDGFWTYKCSCGDSYTVIDENTRIHVNVPAVDAEDIKDKIETEDTEATTEDIQEVIDNVVHGNDAVVDKDIFVDEKNDKVIEQMKQEKPELADKEPVLHITLQGMGVKTESGALVATKLVFDVTPMLGDTKIENLAAPLTFHLPVDNSLTGNAYVYHEGEFMGIYAIVSEGGNNYVVVSSQNFSEFTVEVQNESDVAINTTTKVIYTELQAALNAAAKGETVKLLKAVTAEDIYVGAGKTLDLNGFALTVTSSFSASFTTTHVIDSSNGEGLLVVAGADVALNESNKQLPVWTAAGVKFVEIVYKQIIQAVPGDADAKKFRFYFNVADESILPTLLKEDCITIRVKVNYTTASGLNAYQYFELTDSLIEQYVNKWPNKTFDLTLKGVTGLSGLSFTAEIVSTAPSGLSVVKSSSTCPV